MKIPFSTYVKATITFFRCSRRLGIDEATRRVEQISTQGNFWFKECERLHAAASLALYHGDIEAYNIFYHKHATALERYKREVTEPLRDMIEK